MHGDLVIRISFGVALPPKPPSLGRGSRLETLRRRTSDLNQMLRYGVQVRGLGTGSRYGVQIRGRYVEVPSHHFVVATVRAPAGWSTSANGGHVSGTLKDRLPCVRAALVLFE